ncbi:prolipoprotein diacylglyceryl transferase [Mycobacterium sp. NPDC003323]
MTVTTLAYIPSPDQGVWFIGSVPLRAYALCIIAGIIAALVIGDRRWAARGGERGVIYDIALWAVPFGLVGGRMYHVMTDWPTYFGEGGAGLAAAFRIWDGGLGIWGAVALGALGAWIGCRRRGIPLPAFGDAIAPGIILAQAIGRLGNYFNQELYGRATTVPWGLEIYERRDAAGFRDTLNGVSTGEVIGVVHPTFLYELLWNLLVFVILIWVDRRYKFGHGRLFALYVAGYCLGRFWIELLRSDTATLIAGIRINSFTATFVFIAAVVYIMVAPKGREAPATLAGDQARQLVVEDLDTKVIATGAAGGAAAAVVVADGGGGTGVSEAADRADAEEVAVETEVLEVVEPDDAAEDEQGEPEPELLAVTDVKTEATDSDAEAEPAEQDGVAADEVESSPEAEAADEFEAEAAEDGAVEADEAGAEPDGPEAELLAVTDVEPDAAADDAEAEQDSEPTPATDAEEATDSADEELVEAEAADHTEASDDADNVEDADAEAVEEGDTATEETEQVGPESEATSVDEVEAEAAVDTEASDDADDVEDGKTATEGEPAEPESEPTPEDEVEAEADTADADVDEPAETDGADAADDEIEAAAAALEDDAAGDAGDVIQTGPDAELLAVTDVDATPPDGQADEPAVDDAVLAEANTAGAVAEEPAAEAEDGGDVDSSQDESTDSEEPSTETATASEPEPAASPAVTTPPAAPQPRKRWWQRRR